MPAVTPDAVLKALRRVTDPSRGTDIVTAGLVQGLAVEDGRVRFALDVDAERGADAEPLRAAAATAAASVPGVTAVTAVLTAHRQTQPAKGKPPPQTGVPGVTSVIAVASGKGGVGKSTVAVNLALAFVRLGLRTGLLDADIYGPSLPRLMAITDKPRSKDGKTLEPIEKFGLKTMSIGYLVKEDEPMIWRGPMVMSALTQMLSDVAWAPLDILVIDMPPGTGDAQLTIAQRVPLRGAVIVSTPQDLSLIDARKGIAMFVKTQVPILGIVENMSTFICPNCGAESQIFGHGGARATAAELGVPFLGEIPLLTKIRETSDAGRPVVASDADSREAQAFVNVAHAVSAQLAGSTRPAPRIVME
jgi:ATP-binding protein involved in chromosome partitioning